MFFLASEILEARDIEKRGSMRKILYSTNIHPLQVNPKLQASCRQILPSFALKLKKKNSLLSPVLPGIPQCIVKWFAHVPLKMNWGKLQFEPPSVGLYQRSDLRPISIVLLLWISYLWLKVQIVSPTHGQWTRWGKENWLMLKTIDWQWIPHTLHT